MKTFEDLEVYKKTISFTIEVFNHTKSKTFNKNLANQLERATLSISNNIAEGFELQSNKQFIRYLYISKGSCGECRNIIFIAKELELISNYEYKILNNQAIEISKQLSNFIKYLKKSEIE